MFLPICINLIYTWLLFFKSNFFNAVSNIYSKDTLTVNNNLKNLSLRLYVDLSFILGIFMLVYYACFSYYTFLSWWSHFKGENFFFFLIFFLYGVMLLYLFTVRGSFMGARGLRADYIFSVINFFIFTPLIFFVNTFFTFFFVLEVNSVLIFYKFVVSKPWSVPSVENRNAWLHINSYKEFLNMLFFQFWSSFFSSVLLIFTILVFNYLFSTSEWLIMNYLLSLEQISIYNYLLTLISLVLLFTYFIKIGLTPFHLYKLEVYKGLPYYVVFFYTTLYFFVYFIFFLLLYFFYLNAFCSFWNYFLTFFFFVFVFYLIFLLFDINFLKTFFAYSTIANSFMFILLVVSLSY